MKKDILGCEYDTYECEYQGEFKSEDKSDEFWRIIAMNVERIKMY